MGKDWKKRATLETTAKGVCAEYRDLIQRCETLDEMLDLYRRGADWSLEYDSPSLELVREYKDECEKKGIFVDRRFNGEILDSQQVYIFRNCSGRIRTGLNVKDRIIPMLYFSDGCDMKIEASARLNIHTRVPLFIYGDNKIVSENSGDIECVYYNRERKC